MIQPRVLAQYPCERFPDLTVVNIHIVVFWFMTPYYLICGNQRLRGTDCLILREADYTTAYRRNPKFKFSPP
jgi:hypothetical protein